MFIYVYKKEVDNFIHILYHRVDKIYFRRKFKMNDIIKIWQNVLDIIKVDIIPVSFSTWIETIIPVDMSVDTFSVQVPFEWNVQMIKSKYASLIENALFYITKREYKLDIQVANSSNQKIIQSRKKHRNLSFISILLTPSKPL